MSAQIWTGLGMDRGLKETFCFPLWPLVKKSGALGVQWTMQCSDAWSGNSVRPRGAPGTGIFSLSSTWDSGNSFVKSPISLFARKRRNLKKRKQRESKKERERERENKKIEKAKGKERTAFNVRSLNSEKNSFWFKALSPGFWRMLFLVRSTLNLEEEIMNELEACNICNAPAPKSGIIKETG